MNLDLFWIWAMIVAGTYPNKYMYLAFTTDTSVFLWLVKKITLLPILETLRKGKQKNIFKNAIAVKQSIL